MKLPLLSYSETSRHISQLLSWKVYYESKVSCLSNGRLSSELRIMACRDAPIERSSLDTPWQRASYIRQCLRFYKKKLHEITKELKKVT